MEDLVWRYPICNQGFAVELWGHDYEDTRQHVTK